MAGILSLHLQPVLFAFCAGNELFFAALYVSHFTPGNKGLAPSHHAHPPTHCHILTSCTPTHHFHIMHPHTHPLSHAHFMHPPTHSHHATHTYTHTHTHIIHPYLHTPTFTLTSCNPHLHTHTHSFSHSRHIYTHTYIYSNHVPTHAATHSHSYTSCLLCPV